ncbi:MAG TPA: hypothetical protein VGK26_06180 [Thermoanaerobaculia bacterium]|jgi:hypothetical protein
MLLLQTLISLLRRSAGKVIESIFGWAVAALFGEVRKNEKTALSAAVAGVALWPILLAGVALPRVAAFVLALVPLPKHTPVLLLRIVWAALALLVPIAVGFILQRREGLRRWGYRQILAGFPLSAGLSAAFLLAFVALPFQKLAAAVHGESEEHVTLIVEEASLDEVASTLRKALDEDGLPVEPADAPWLARAIAAVLRATARTVGKTASRPRYFRGPDLELTLFPHGATVRGLPRAASRAHAVLAATATRTPALQTTDPEAQKLERRIKELWSKAEHRRSGAVSDRLYGEIARALSRLSCSFEDWETVYRECLQLGLLTEGVADPIAETGAGRFQRDSRARGRSRRLARRARGLTRETAISSAAKSVISLAEKFAQRMLAPRRR